MKKDSFLVRLLINAVVFLIVSSLYSGINVDGFWAAVFAALILGLINALLKPILFVLTLPINFLTFGLFTFVLNGIMLLLTDKLYDGIQIAGFGAAIIAAFLFSIVNAILSSILVKGEEH
jgi:putative membrane protein